MVLHLEGVAFHAASHREPGLHLMGQGPDIAERAIGIDDCGEFGPHFAAVDMLDIEWVASDPLQGMENDETRPVGEEVAVGFGSDDELELAI